MATETLESGHERRTRFGAAVSGPEVLGLLLLVPILTVAAVSWFVRGGGQGPILPGPPHIYVMNADGSGLRSVASEPSFLAVDPTWSPDGHTLAISGGDVRNDRPGPPHIWSMDLESGGKRQITFGGNLDLMPAWSPDGSRIAYVSFDPRRPEANDIFIVRPDGTDMQQLTNDEHLVGKPSWSPDGNQLVYAASDRPDSPWRLFVINADGSGKHLVQDYSRGTAWSPDGRTLAFDSGRSDSGQVDIFALDLASGSVNRLTSNLAYDGDPSWSPDGKRLVFDSERTHRLEIFAMKADGTGVVNLSKAAGVPGLHPVWSPAGDRIAFNSWIAPEEKK